MPRMTPMLTSDQIQSRVKELATEIANEYADRPLTLIGVMTGSLMFLSDLVRELEIPHQLGVLQASSYQGATTTAGPLRTQLDFLPCLKNRDVVLIDDILDTGQTLHRLIEQLQSFEPASVKSAVLLWKPERTQLPIKPDYVGFSIEDRFVIGYGLDYDENYRHLPSIYEWLGDDE